MSPSSPLLHTSKAYSSNQLEQNGIGPLRFPQGMVDLQLQSNASHDTLASAVIPTSFNSMDSASDPGGRFRLPEYNQQGPLPRGTTTLSQHR